MTWSQRIDSVNKYWRMLGTVTTVGVMVGGGLYAAGRDTEKFSASQVKIKADVAEVQTTIGKIEESVQNIVDTGIPKVVELVEANHREELKLADRVAQVTERHKEDKKEVNEIKKEVQDIKQQLSAMKVQQKTDADWIKGALLRIEAKQ